MALFDENDTIAPPPRRRLSRATVAGMWALAVALIVLLALTFLPTSYVIQQPGPGLQHARDDRRPPTAQQVPLISVEGAETFPTDGALDLLTVQVAGNRERTPSWFELARAWFDPSKAVMPIDAVFPQGQTTEERNEESAAMMVDSQNEATAAALTELGYDVNPQISVHSLTDDSAATGVLEVGDVILEAERRAGDGCRSPARHRERRRRRPHRDADRARRRRGDGLGDARSRSRSTASRPGSSA